MRTPRTYLFSSVPTQYIHQFTRSMIRPVILPLMPPGHQEPSLLSGEATSNYTLVSPERSQFLLRDYIRLRLAFNFQFEKVGDDHHHHRRRSRR